MEEIKRIREILKSKNSKWYPQYYAEIEEIIKEE